VSVVLAYVVDQQSPLSICIGLHRWITFSCISALNRKQACGGKTLCPQAELTLKFLEELELLLLWIECYGFLSIAPFPSTPLGCLGSCGLLYLDLPHQLLHRALLALLLTYRGGYLSWCPLRSRYRLLVLVLAVSFPILHLALLASIVFVGWLALENLLRSLRAARLSLDLSGILASNSVPHVLIPYVGSRGLLDARSQVLWWRA
jgi:hypothetical protein